MADCQSSISTDKTAVMDLHPWVRLGVMFAVRTMLVVLILLLIMCAASVRAKDGAASSSTDAKPRFTYTLQRDSEPTPEQERAYATIVRVMDKAIRLYNEHTIHAHKHLTVKYSPSTPTADGSNNGTIRIGKKIHTAATAMHEIAHTLGVGTSAQWRKLVVNHVYTGKRGTEALRQVTGNQNAVLHGDRSHFWPYGLNYDKEVKSEQDLIKHCKIVDAIYEDLKAAGMR